MPCFPFPASKEFLFTRSLLLVSAGVEIGPGFFFAGSVFDVLSLCREVGFDLLSAGGPKLFEQLLW